jgi:hypothetical protein
MIFKPRFFKKRLISLLRMFGSMLQPVGSLPDPTRMSENLLSAGTACVGRANRIRGKEL